MTDLRIVATNTSAHGGTYTTPFWFAAHDGSFDLYNTGEAASAALEALAEDGNFAPANEAVVAADADAVTGAVLGAGTPPILAPGETATAEFSVDGSSNGHLSLAAMVIPSNDAFVGTADSLQLFDENGHFMGEQNITFAGSDVLDAGTEVNSEIAEEVPLLGQMVANTGTTEGGVVSAHEGFLPEGEGNILGGTNALGEHIDAVAADFTRDGAQIADIHINEYAVTEGSNGFDFFRGSSVDDLVNGAGGRDVLIGRGGWDELDGGEGNDILIGNRGNDMLTGGEGRDILKGGSGSDTLDGGAGRDILKGNKGSDVLDGGAGRDRMNGGHDADLFVFQTGYDRDRIIGFDADEDTIALHIEGVESFDDLSGLATDHGNRTILDFGEGDALVIKGVTFDELSAANFDFL